MVTQLKRPDSLALALAAKLLGKGQVVAFPTETVYGLGANALNPAAVQKIFVAKQRPADNPLIVHISDAHQVKGLIAEMPSLAKPLMDTFWPGPLTLIFPRGEAVPDAVSPGLSTVSVRLPAHPVARKLISLAGVPLAAPSANRSGSPSPTTAQHVLDDMNGRIPLILDGGSCQVGLESTVLDITTPVPIVLRPGAVTVEMLQRCVGEVLVDESALQPVEGGQVRSPGMKYKHYAPMGKVLVVEGSAQGVQSHICAQYDAALAKGERVLILAPAEDIQCYGERQVLSFGSEHNPEAAAQTLYACLRKADQLEAQLILAQGVKPSGMGLAIMNRLYRAAGFDRQWVE